MTEELWDDRGLPHIQNLMSDCGPEFCESWADLSAARNGVRRLATVPYTPQQNGKVERLHRVVDLNAQMLSESNPRWSQWDCLRAAVRAYNEAPGSTGLSPIYRMFGCHRSRFDIFNINPAECEQKEEAYPKDQQQRWAIARQARENYIAIQTSKKLRTIILGAPKRTPATGTERGTRHPLSGYPRVSLTPLQPNRRLHWPTRTQVRCTLYPYLALVRLRARKSWPRRPILLSRPRRLLLLPMTRWPSPSGNFRLMMTGHRTRVTLTALTTVPRLHPKGKMGRCRARAVVSSPPRSGSPPARWPGRA